jgi:hypothetical protein
MEVHMRLLKMLRVTQFLTCVAVVMLVMIAGFLYVQINTPRGGVPISIVTPTRDQINAAVVKLILAGRSGELYSFYAYEVGDPLKAALYVQSALDGTIPAPVNLVIAVGWWEGGHQAGGVDGPNLNGSYDVRPMGLNSKTYKQYSMADLQRVELNIPLGVAHLVGERQKWNVSWESAMASYNKGSPSGLDQRQIDYVAAVLRHEWELDRKFAARFPEMF